ncbi:hypothetical protein E4U57_001697, partial [Claviceps arundinis]
YSTVASQLQRALALVGGVGRYIEMLDGARKHWGFRTTPRSAERSTPLRAEGD